jgi:hypothetical protein
MSHIFKGIFFCFLLVPISIISDTNSVLDNTNASMQELRQELAKKLFKISEMGKVIAEKDMYMQSLRTEIENFIAQLMMKKKLKEQALFEFGEAIDKDIQQLNVSLHEAFAKRDIKGFFVKILFSPEEELETIKFYVIRAYNEYLLLRHFVEEYEMLEQEIIDIKQELELKNKEH